MAQINKVIGPQNYEIVRDRIGSIIADELNNQFQIAYDPDLRLSVWNERTIPFDNDKEMPSINVMLAEDQFDYQTPVDVIGNARYFVDLYFAGAHGGNDGRYGDSKANWTMQKVMGKVRSILMHSAYKTLGFTPGFIANRHVESINIQLPDQKRLDAEHVVMGRLVVSVRMNETSPGVDPTVLNDFVTTIKIEETDLGYLYKVYNGY
jgi:hypothetical protein